MASVLIYIFTLRPRFPGPRAVDTEDGHRGKQPERSWCRVSLSQEYGGEVFEKSAVMAHRRI